MRREASLDRLSNYSDQSLLDELRRVARVLGKPTLTINDIESHARCSYAVLKLRFGGLRQALTRAGLQSPPLNRNVSDDQLLDELERIWDAVLETEGRRPYVDDLKTYSSQFSRGPYFRRWGSWIKACEALLERSPRAGSSRSENSSPPFLDAQAAISSRRPKRPIALKVRYDVMRRDGFRCLKCGRSPATHHGLKLHVDHINPESSGGLAVMENLRTLCDECNVGRGAARDEVAQPGAAGDAPQAPRP